MPGTPGEHPTDPAKLGINQRSSITFPKQATVAGQLMKRFIGHNPSISSPRDKDRRQAEEKLHAERVGLGQSEKRLGSEERSSK